MPQPLSALTLALAFLALTSCASHCRKSEAAAGQADTITAPTDPSPAPTDPRPVPTDDIVEPEPTAETGTVPLGQACGPGVGACDAAGYCVFPAANVCGDGGVVGVCEARTRGCQKDCKGVCGCDGKRYCNACSAQNRGVSVRHAGRCESND
ncbi:MAG: hypothetical protein JNJ59_19610 [Deltaproteobacteria bacterium]|nr:hypothetical protein [Deltaproteobacteria bacterium]